MPSAPQSDPSVAWLFRLDHRTYHARHLRRQHVTDYERQTDGADVDSKQRRRALWLLLRRAFPWRPSYWLRGDPVTIVLDGDRELRSRALGEVLANVR